MMYCVPGMKHGKLGSYPSAPGGWDNSEASSFYGILSRFSLSMVYKVALKLETRQIRRAIPGGVVSSMSLNVTLPMEICHPRLEVAKSRSSEICGKAP